MNIDDRLDRVRDELADEVAADVRVPSFAGVLARRARRRRLQAAAGGAAVAVVAAAVVGGLAATRPGPHHAVPPAVTVSVSPSPSPTGSPTTAPSSAQTYPAPGASYVVVPDGDQLAWTDLKTGAHGHFGPTSGSGQLSDPSVSADGRRIAYKLNRENGIAVWDLDTRAALPVMPAISIENSVAISPDGTKVLWTEQGGVVRMASVGVPSSAQTLTSDGSPAAWDGNDAIAYAAYGTQLGGQCAIVRLDLSSKATHCLLPTATLQSVFAADGSNWQINDISGVPDGGLFALGLNTEPSGGGPDTAIGLLSVGAEATPFRVLQPTVVADPATQAVASPVLVDNGARLLYAQVQQSADQSSPGGAVIMLDLATGAKTTVTSGQEMGASPG